LPDGPRVLNHHSIPDDGARQAAQHLGRDEVLAQVRELEDDPLFGREVLEPEVVVHPVRVQVDERVARLDRGGDDGAHEQLVHVVVLDRLVVLLPAEVDERHEDFLELFGHR
jgi:hypothetical protein